MDGYFLIERRLLSHRIWLCEPFSRGQAWADIVGLANHSDGYIRIAGQRIEIKRGQCGWSEVRLADRWQWSRDKVRRFLNELERDEMIHRETNTRTTILTVCNYTHYQFNNTTDDTTDDTTEKHQTRQQTDTNKEERKNNNPLYPPLFDEFWETFPRQRIGSKENALKAWNKATTRSTPGDILAGAKAYSTSDEVKRGFAKGAAAWLNDDRWRSAYHSQPDTPWYQTQANRMPSEAGG